MARQGRRASAERRQDAVPSASAKGAVVPAAARTMAVFEIFAQEKRELSKSEVSRLLDVPESSGSDLLNTMHDLGYLARTPTTRRYYPTGRLLSMAAEIGDNSALAVFGAEATALLSQRTGETAVCAVLLGERIKIEAVYEAHHRLRYVLEAGEILPTHATAVGKALLGGLSDDEMSRVLRLHPLTRHTDHTVVDPVAVEQQVRRGRERGWYAAVDESTQGVSSLAVSAHVGLEVVGLGVAGPSTRVLPAADELREILLDVADTVFEAAH